MDDEKENVGNETSGVTTASETPSTEEQASENGEAKEKEGVQASFTQEQVNDIVRQRLDKAYKSIYERYGVEDEKGLDEIMASAQECQATKMLYDEIVKENKALKEKIAFSDNGILADKQDDVRTYFKGKGLEMSDEALKSVIQTHPEWIAKKETEAPRTTIIPLGAERQEGLGKKPDEEAKAAKMFGLGRFI